MAWCKFLLCAALYLVLSSTVTFGSSYTTDLIELQDSSEDEVLLCEPNPDDGTCKCSGGSCGCCRTLSIKKLHLKKIVCINVTYLREEIGLQLTLTLDGKVIFTKKVSVKNPPPLCLKIPLVKKLAKVCIEFYNLTAGNNRISGCARFTTKLIAIKVIKLDLGCFRIPLPHDETYFENDLVNQLSYTNGRRTTLNDVLVAVWRQRLIESIVKGEYPDEESMDIPFQA